MDREKNEIKDMLTQMISTFVKNYMKREDIHTKWEEPIVKFGVAKDKAFDDLKKIISSDHISPKEVMSDAETVISYFLPFDKSIVDSNLEGKYCSKEWIAAYVETNNLIADINTYIKNEIEKLGYKAVLPPKTHDFDKTTLISNWSNKHIAHICGLGKFGINNILITDKGCCGRLGNIVTSIRVESSKKDDREYCLNKINGSCNKCLNNCVAGAINVDDFDRAMCYEVLKENRDFHGDNNETTACGKCCVGLPCSTINPGRNL